MKKLLPFLVIFIMLFQSCKIYDSKSSTKEDAIIFGGKVRVKSDTKSSYKFEKLIIEGDSLFGIGKRQLSKSKIVYNNNIVNKNATDKNVKILLTDDLVNEIHLYNKGKSNALKIIGIGAIALYVLLGFAALLLLLAV